MVNLARHVFDRVSPKRNTVPASVIKSCVSGNTGNHAEKAKRILISIVAVPVVLVLMTGVASGSCYMNPDGTECVTVKESEFGELFRSNGWQLISEDKVCQYKSTDSPPFSCIDLPDQNLSQPFWCSVGIALWPVFYEFGYQSFSNNPPRPKFPEPYPAPGPWVHMGANEYIAPNVQCYSTPPGIAPTCGNGVEEYGEFCDDGSQNGTPGKCFNDCQKMTPLCGNGVVEYPEVCDDGNLDWASGDCNPTCTGHNAFDMRQDTPGGQDVCAWGNFRDHANNFCKWKMGVNAYHVNLAYQEGSWTSCCFVDPNTGPSACNNSTKASAWYVWCHPGETPSSIEVFGPQTPDSIARVSFYGTAEQSGIQKVFYQVDGTSGVWKELKKCQTNEFSSGKVKFQFVTDALNPGNHQVFVKIVNSWGMTAVSDPYDFTVQSYTPPANPQHIAVGYDMAQINQYLGEPVADQDPESNLHLFMNSNGWIEIPILTLDRNNKTVTTKTDSLDYEYRLIYKSPGCVMDY
jgi:cysteine-rich repeat protein